MTVIGFFRCVKALWGVITKPRELMAASTAVVEDNVSKSSNFERVHLTPIPMATIFSKPWAYDTV